MERLGARAITSNGRLRSSVSMDKKLPQIPEMKAFQAYLDGKMSPRKKMEIRKRQLRGVWLTRRECAKLSAAGWRRNAASIAVG